MAMPSSGSRDNTAPLPTVGQARCRYGHRSSRLQAERLGTAEATFASAAHMYGRFAGLRPPGQGQVSVQGPVQAEHGWSSGQADALQQVRHVAGQKSGASMHFWPGDYVVVAVHKRLI